MFVLYFSDMVIYVRQVDYILDVLSNVLDLGLKTVQIGFSSLDNTIVEQKVAFMADDKFEHDSAKEIQQLSRRWLHILALAFMLYKCE